jgi:hypothetical protein
LKAKIYRNGNNEYGRIIIPAKFTGTGKRQCRFFKTKEEAEAKAASIAKTGTSTEPEFSEEDVILFRFLKEHGIATIEQFDRTFKDLLSKRIGEMVTHLVSALPDLKSILKIHRSLEKLLEELAQDLKSQKSEG